MQEWIDTCIAAHDVQLWGVTGWKERPATMGADFSMADFTRDANYHTLDLSGIIDVDAVQVFSIAVLRATGAGAYGIFKSPASPDASHGNQINIIVANQWHIQTIHHYPGYTREMDYKFSISGWTHIYMTIRGWIERMRP